MYLKSLTCLFFFICLIGHTLIGQSLVHDDPKLATIVNRSLDYFGGLEQYKSIKYLSYHKSLKLYLEDGSVEQTNHEQHTYDFVNQKYSIDRDINGEQSYLLFDKGNYFEVIDGDTIASEKAKTTFDIAFYVTAMPFKLLDAGAELSLQPKVGSDHVLKVTYDSTKYANHRGDEPWLYYIDAETGDMTQQIAHTSDHISLVKNEAYHTVDGFRFINLRTGYRVNEDYEILYKRAAYDYSNLVVEF